MLQAGADVPSAERTRAVSRRCGSAGRRASPCPSRRAYALWRSDPFHPSLQFKQVTPRWPIYSVRVGIGFRALGLREENHVYWFWIGSHAEYDDLLKHL
jgi:hypothetical protein